MQSTVELEFDVGRCNGTMQVQIYADQTMLANIKSFDQNTATLTYEIPWPCVVRIVLSNKFSRDTKVDQHGNIVEDKYIELKKLSVDRCEASMQFMKSISLTTQDQVLNKLYWGFNGTVTLNFDQSDSFLWHLASRTQVEKNYILIDHTKI
jgi:hypothetical protein